jgi:hypothetical protein
MVRGDVDEDRGLHRWRWHLAPLERRRDQDAAANTGRGERLIGKQFGETELECRCAREWIAGRRADPAPDATLREVCSSLQEHRHDEPPRLGALCQLHECPLF